MRILFVTKPGLGLIFPLIPTAWALRAAGHDVVLATSGFNLQTAANTGLQVIDAAPGVNFFELFNRFSGEHEYFVEQQLRGMDPAADPAAVDFAARMFALVSEAFAEHTVAFAKRWRPDLVIYTPLQGAGALAAAVLGVPSVLHGVGLGPIRLYWQAIAEKTTAVFERYGVAPPDPVAVVDVSPPELRWEEEPVIPMRYVPFNGGTVIPGWLLEPRERPRITVTLGSVLPATGGVPALKSFVDAAGAVDAEFVLALGGVDISALGTLPANLRTVDWIPLSTLLTGSDAVINHGGPGSTLASLDAGLPQYMIPVGADQLINPGPVVKAGAGLVLRPNELDRTRLAALAADTDLRKQAQRIAAQMHDQPSPLDVAPQLAALAQNGS